jgi:murein tripeptide amidase MpaA
MRNGLPVGLVGSIGPTLLLALTLAPFAAGQDVRSSAPPGFSFDYGRWPYPLNEEIGRELHDLAKEYPRLARVHRIGASRRGQPLWVIELTNFDTGPGESKPGLWMDGNIHAWELTGRPYLRYFVRRLLYSYGKDERTTRMLDTRTFYVMPVFDVDGGDLVLSRHPAWPGYDADEQVGDDLDGDGYITQMRVPDAEDGYKYYKESLEALDRRAQPSFLQRRRRNELTGEREGGDFNRNWSAEWNAAEPGAGSRPFSLPEVAAVADCPVRTTSSTKGSVPFGRT